MLAATAALGIMPATAVADEPVVPPPSVPVIGAALAAPAGPLPDVARAGIAAVPVATAARSCRGVHSRRGVRRQRAAVRCLVNRARGSVGLRGFRRSGALARAATRHARDMARRGYFAHQRWGGPSLLRRARASGWRGGTVGEALAWGCRHSATPLTAVLNWLESPPHRAILLSGRLRRSGVGVSKAPVSCHGRTYVLDAGRG
jgi:uncharacterized protein YkwD